MSNETIINATDILEIQMFGNFDILFNGHSIFNKGKHVNKIFEILKYMIVNNDKELSPEIICENIWPDKEYMDVRNTVTTYIFRLNKFLKDGNLLKKDISDHLRIVCQKGSYKLIISEKSILDLKKFNRLYEEVENSKDQDYRGDLILEAIELYRGELLSGANFDSWITPYRNYYRRLFSEMTRIILFTYMNNADYKEILKVCKMIFEVYALDEYANLYYLKALFELNYINEAITHYEYISSRYISELGIQPNKEMKELYLKMKNKRNINKELLEPNPTANITQLFSEDSEFWKIFSTAIDDYMDKNAETKTYSIGFASINSCDDPDELEDAIVAFKKAIQNVLRKEDCFTFFEPDIFVFVLNDVPETFYNLIKERIEKIFRENYKKDIKFSISINSSYASTRFK